jgi:hypothetical protein
MGTLPASAVFEPVPDAHRPGPSSYLRRMAALSQRYLPDESLSPAHFVAARQAREPRDVSVTVQPCVWRVTMPIRVLTMRMATLKTPHMDSRSGLSVGIPQFDTVPRSPSGRWSNGSDRVKRREIQHLPMIAALRHRRGEGRTLP